MGAGNADDLGHGLDGGKVTQAIQLVISFLKLSHRCLEIGDIIIFFFELDTLKAELLVPFLEHHLFALHISLERGDPTIMGGQLRILGHDHGGQLLDPPFSVVELDIGHLQSPESLVLSIHGRIFLPRGPSESAHPRWRSPRLPSSWPQLTDQHTPSTSEYCRWISEPSKASVQDLAGSS